MNTNRINDVVSALKNVDNIDLQKLLYNFTQAYSIDFWNQLYQYSLYNNEILIKSLFLRNPSLPYLRNKNKIQPLRNMYYFQSLTYPCQIYFYSEYQGYQMMQFILQTNYFARNPSLLLPSTQYLPFWVRFKSNYNEIKNDITKFPNDLILTEIDYVRIGSMNSPLDDGIFGYNSNALLMEKILPSLQLLYGTSDKDKVYNLKVNDENIEDIKLQLEETTNPIN